MTDRIPKAPETEQHRDLLSRLLFCAAVDAWGGDMQAMRSRISMVLALDADWAARHAAAAAAELPF